MTKRWSSTRSDLLKTKRVVEVSRARSEMTAYTLARKQAQCWIEELIANCERIARTETGTDREGWLKDAGHFKRVLALIKIGRSAGGTAGEEQSR